MMAPGDAAMEASLAEQICSAPLPGATDEMAARLAEVADGSPRLAELLGRLEVAALMRGVAAGSGYLWTLIRLAPDRCAALLDQSPHAALDRIVATLDRTMTEAPDEAQAMRALRVARQEAALLVALADLGGVWSLSGVTAALTRFAEAAVRSALAFLVREAVRGGRLRPGTEAGACGLAVLALGKAGGRELNYSSDIDLVVLFDPAAPALDANTAAAPFFVKLTQALARLLQQRTAEGFVLRVDLRLRPDPASTAVAIAVPAALHYYETLGQNWERAAFIKARPIAGDGPLATAVLRDLEPFVWRKYFDYAAIADVHAMKRQINAAHDRTGGPVAGRDLKLGRGGIREIEFFVQTQQLIFGGRRPALRGRDTCGMLAALAREGWIDDAARDELTDAYTFLRTIEHRLQMTADQQTQRLPVGDEDLRRLARFSGFDEVAAFSATLTGHLQRVERSYARLFEHAPNLGAAEGNLVFTGTDLDPATIHTLRAMGYRRPEVAVELVRGWHFGRRPAVQSARTREVLTELVPDLLAAMARAADPDGALATFDTVLARVRSAGELLSLLRSSRGLRDLFADVLGSAPSLAAIVADRPHVLDAAIDPGLLVTTGGAPAARVAAALREVGATEDFLDRMRDVVAEENFVLGLRTLTASASLSVIETARSDIADVVVQAALARCTEDFARRHGRLRGGGCVVLGMGRLGSREMAATSDLDLIVVYRHDPDSLESDGEQPLDPARYYTRLTQRLIAALTAPTRRGRLYDVDVRLRPSGRHGPLAIRYAAFVAYHADAAQTWEHMALTRARVVAGDAALAQAVAHEIARILGRHRDLPSLRQDVAAMRALVEREKPPTDVWDMKLSPGGLLDIEFVAQFLQLAYAGSHPGLCLQHPVDVLGAAERFGLLAPSQSALLVAAYRLQAGLLHLLRLMTTGPTSLDRLDPGVVARLCQLTGRPEASQLHSELIETRGEVRRLLEHLLEQDLSIGAVHSDLAIRDG